MNIPPPSDDERIEPFEDFEDNQISRSRRRRRETPYNPDITRSTSTRPATSSQARRNRPQRQPDPNQTVLERPASSPSPYQTVEEPFVPKVRRASLPVEGRQRISQNEPLRSKARPAQHGSNGVPSYPQRQRAQPTRPQRTKPAAEAPLYNEDPVRDTNRLPIPEDLAPMPPLRRVKPARSDNPGQDQLQGSQSTGRMRSAQRPAFDPGETAVDTPPAPSTGRMRAVQRPMPPAEEEFLVKPELPSTGRMRAVSPPAGIDPERTVLDRPQPTTTGRMRATPRPGAYPETPLRGRTQTTDKIRRPSVADQRRNAGFAALPNTPRAYPHRRGLVGRLQNLRRNRPLLLVIALLLLILILGPILTNSHQQTSQAGITGSGKQTSSKPGITPVPVIPLNPHEIVITPPTLDHPAPSVFATSAYLLDADTGATLYAKNPFMHLPILSTTKLMTATLAVEHGNLNQRIKITPAIWNDIAQLSPDGTMYRVNDGSTYTLRELLYGLLMVSGNDAAVAIADDIGGNLPTFTKMMNQRAKELGMNDTHYVNPHGLLDPGHYSSAHDLAIIGQHALTNPIIEQISGTHKMTVPHTNDHPGRLMINGNQFLWWYQGVDSGKPGWDGDKNFVQVISCIRNHRHLIGVVIRATDWWTDMRTLLNYGFNTYNWQSPAIVDQKHPIPFDYEDGYFASDTRDRTIPTANGGRYFIATGYSISGPILRYFDNQGGLQKFGFPNSLPNSVSNTVSKQSFEHGTIQCNSQTNQCKLL